MDITEDQFDSFAQWPASASPRLQAQPPEVTPLRQPLGSGQSPSVLVGGFFEHSSPVMDFSPHLGWDDSPLAYRQVHAPNLPLNRSALFRDSPIPLGAPFEPRSSSMGPSPPGLGQAVINGSPWSRRLFSDWDQVSPGNPSTAPLSEATPCSDIFLGTSTASDQLAGAPIGFDVFMGRGIAGHSTWSSPGDDNPYTPCAPGQDQESFEQRLRRFSQPQNNRVRKPRFSDQGLNPHETILAEQGALPQTRRFPGLFSNAEAANRAMNDLQNAWRMPKADYTTPADDASFPATDADMVAVVAKVFDAISDWSHVTEWKNTLPRHDRARITGELVARSCGGLDVFHSNSEGLRPSDSELAGILPSLEVQQKKILGQVPSDQAIECISWGIVQAAIKSQQGFTQVPYWCEQDGTSKQLVKSLLTAGDGWRLRIVNAPTKEFQAKAKNRRVNAKRPGLKGNVDGRKASTV
ncbi:hypothetical protein CP532_4677 [Ophiocordyceps camponoti-leonardi (nom. inval.)]|nr:hypothetical protein CP532_4677 [Ophiocordyceps camponoti-leonardi (nom. inval.)]